MRVPKNCPDEYRNKVESGRVPRNGKIKVSTENDRIRPSTGKARIRVSTEKLSDRVPKNGRIRMSTGIWYNPIDYSEKVESVRVLKTVRTSTEKL